MPAAPLKVFICYAREDREALEALMGHLAVFARNGSVQFWYDAEITGGKDWDETIRFNLKTADIVLLLISPDFFKSDYIHSVELAEALQRDRDKEALVVPVILKKCLWHKQPEIARLQALPSEGHPIYDKKHWPEIDDGYYDVAEGFDRILEDPEIHFRKRARVYNELAREKGLPEMVLVKGGSFMMGEIGIAEPVHQVTLSDFFIGKYPVTQKQWREVMGNNPSHFKGCDDCPVESVSWDDVQVFIQQLNKKTGQSYRLPTEAEWEYAARGGAMSKGFKYAGSDNLNEVGWFWENSGDKPLSGNWDLNRIKSNNCRTHPVKQKRDNGIGIYDMSGNIWEWCNDWYGDYPKEAQVNPAGPVEGVYRVDRGGSWDNTAGFCRVALRNRAGPSDRDSDVGFRLVLQL